MYQTEAQVRLQAIEALKAKRRTPTGDLDVARIEEELQDPRYARWIQARVDAKREQKLLVTDRQFQDLRARRSLEVDDRVRYIGPTRMETSPVTGKMITRPTNQIGTITRVQKQSNRQTVYTFSPDIDAQTRAAADNGLDIEVLQLETTDWILFERLP